MLLDQLDGKVKNKQVSVHSFHISEDNKSKEEKEVAVEEEESDESD